MVFGVFERERSVRRDFPDFSGVDAFVLGVLGQDSLFSGVVLVTLGVTGLDLVLGVTDPELGTSGVVVVGVSLGVLVRDLRIRSTGV